MKLDILCNYWDDPIGLMRLLESPGLASITDTIHILDGQYVDHKGKQEYDSDLTFSIIRNYSNHEWDGKIDFRKIEGLTQVEKRNSLWSRVSDVDYAVVLDSDEYVELDTGLFESELDGIVNSESRCFDLKSSHMGTDYKLPRLFKKHNSWNFQHIKSHGSLYDMYIDKEIIDDRHRQKPVSGFKIIHDKITRSVTRVDDDREYKAIPDH